MQQRRPTLFFLILSLFLSIGLQAQFDDEPAPVKKKTTKKAAPKFSGKSILYMRIDGECDLYVDDIKVGHFEAGGSEKINISGGEHIITAKSNGVVWETDVETQNGEQTIVRVKIGEKIADIAAKKTNEERAKIAERERVTAAIAERERVEAAEQELLVYVKGGTFTMGCTSEQSGCGSDEKPAHTVILNDFYIGKYEVT